MRSDIFKGSCDALSVEFFKAGLAIPDISQSTSGPASNLNDSNSIVRTSSIALVSTVQEALAEMANVLISISANLNPLFSIVSRGPPDDE